MGAHLAWVSETPSLILRWNTVWQGQLSIEQVKKLIGDTSSIQEWFAAPKVSYTVDWRALIYRQGDAGHETVKWKEAPAGNWHYWIDDADPSTLPLDLQEGLSPMDPDLEGALDTSFHNDELRALHTRWISIQYGGIPNKPIERVQAMELARAFRTTLWPLLDRKGPLGRIRHKIEKMYAKLRAASLGTIKVKLSKADKELGAQLKKLDESLFGKP